ncbi:TonB-dependent receptor family protein [Zavarzinia sp. CC-PAN008]|uniref:TonB-dependent receptor family protein n=1 Tax=Zavarzinia sp. CC-PAN008 TaxID=3243332 RepID=UPI003F7469BB
MFRLPAAVAHATACLAPMLLATTCLTGVALAQSGEPTPAADATLQLPPLTVEAPFGSITTPSTEAAEDQARQIPGAVHVIPDSVYRNTQATTLKDILDYTPGVFAQPKWGEDTRLSIRGSGLSRNFHLRGIELFQDGIPFNTSDGSADFQEIDPTAYRYVEVLKGANGLRFGGRTLGGVVNLVTPSGYDARLFDGRLDYGSFDFRRAQASTGGVWGQFDGYITGSWQATDGFRDHSEAESQRVAGNFGYRFSDAVETRIYFGSADIEQEIPGAVTRSSALENPKDAATGNVRQHYQRNIQSWRLASKTTIDLDTLRLEFGGFAVEKELQHPIFQYLDYTYHDYGGFGRVTHEDTLFGRDNRFILGVNVHGGWIDNEQYVNLPGAIKGALLSASTDRSWDVTVYAENALEIVPGVTAILGLQYLYADRSRRDLIPGGPDTTGFLDYQLLNPKAGVIWQVRPEWQVFANVSSSAEPPTFGELNFTNLALADTDAQRALTVEIGTRGEVTDLRWEVAAYRAMIEDEFLFFDLGGGNFAVTNADETIHQGLEIGGSWTFWRGLLLPGEGGDDLSLNLAYTFSDFYFDDDVTWADNELPGAPRHYIRAEVVYHHPSGFYFGPNLEWVPEAYYVDNANTVSTSPYGLLGFKAGFDDGGPISVYLDARNVTDQTYIASASTTGIANANSALFEPGTGRAIFAGLRLRW